MKDYIFVLGRDRDLSLLEIESYFISRKILYSIVLYVKNIVIVSLPELNFMKLINDLGGTIKISEVISNTKDFDDKFDKMSLDFNQKKLFFSLGIYNNSQLANSVIDYFKF